MDIGLVKKKYGDKLCLMGNIDARHTLPFGTPREVEKAAYGGGLIICSADILQAGFPVENVLSIYRAVKKYGTYPIKKAV